VLRVADLSNSIEDLLSQGGELTGEVEHWNR
jgi:hypothetical protein